MVDMEISGQRESRNLVSFILHHSVYRFFSPPGNIPDG